VAVTLAAVSGLGATACQISLVPYCAFARRRSCHVTPPPVTVANVCAPDAVGPSELTKARRSSLLAVVVNAGDTMVRLFVPWLVVTS
jgi:hypothetical protein